MYKKSCEYVKSGYGTEKVTLIFGHIRVYASSVEAPTETYAAHLPSGNLAISSFQRRRFRIEITNMPDLGVLQQASEGVQHGA